MSEAGEGGHWVKAEWWDVRGVGRVGYWGVTPRGDHAFLSEEAVQRVTEGGEESGIQRPVTELRLPHALQQVWTHHIKPLNSATEQCSVTFLLRASGSNNLKH